MYYIFSVISSIYLAKYDNIDASTLGSLIVLILAATSVSGICIAILPALFSWF